MEPSLKSLPPLVAIDTETGGAGELQCTTHALLSVGAYISLTDAAGAPRPLTFHQLILPEPHLKIEEEARAVNGYNYADWKRRGAVDEHTALMRFLNWTAMVYAVAGMQGGEKLQFLSHNVGHDRGFLYAGLTRTGMLGTLSEMVSRRWECSCAALGYWRRKYGIPGGCSQDDLVALQTGVSLEAVKKNRGVHRADDDALICYYGYQWLQVATPADVLWPEDAEQQAAAAAENREECL